MLRRHPRATRTDTLFPYTTLFRSAACHRALASVDQGHAPRLDAVAQLLHGVVRQVEGDVRPRQGIVAEERLDHVALVAAADHEIVQAVRRVDLHDVPEDRQIGRAWWRERVCQYV